MRPSLSFGRSRTSLIATKTSCGPTCTANRRWQADRASSTRATSESWRMTCAPETDVGRRCTTNSIDLNWLSMGCVRLIRKFVLSVREGHWVPVVMFRLFLRLCCGRNSLQSLRRDPQWNKFLNLYSHSVLDATWTACFSFASQW